MRNANGIRLALVLLLACPLTVHAHDAERSYQHAQKAYLALRADKSRRQFRHHWLNVASQYEGVASKFPKSHRAPEALFSAAELLQELSRISGAEEDLGAAISDYQKLCDAYPRGHPAADARMALSKIYLERQGKPALARRVLEEGLKQHPSREMAREMKTLLASLAPELSKPLEKETKEAEEPPRPLRAQVVRRMKLVEKERGEEITLAEQLGLKVRRVIIDAGHGGHDSGALGRSGTTEKDVSLAIAKRLKEILSQGGLQVVLTRTDDHFVPLEQRARLANGARGDLFISIHCNSAQSRKLRGIETYTLNTASDRYSIRLAARENSSSAKGMSDLQFILADLATKANTDESERLATKVQKSLVSHLSSKYGGVKDLGTKEALFYVLLGTKMPAILVETAFLSNPEDERRLGSRVYQRDVASAIATGIREFLESRQRIAKTD